MAHYPADTFQKATEIAIEASNQLHGVINGDTNAEVTVEDGSKIPSVRKAYIDSLFFLSPQPWSAGEYETVYNQLRAFIEPTGITTWWFSKTATVSTPILMSTTPHEDSNWTLWNAINNSVYETQKRLAAEVGFNMVGSFLLGATVTNTNDVVFYETDGKYYKWGGDLSKTILAGTNPYLSGGIGITAWIDSTSYLLKDEVDYNKNKAETDYQSGILSFTTDTGTANAYICTYSPVITSRIEGQVLRFKVANTNTGASTINDGAGIVPLVGGAHSALQGGELVSGGDAWVQWNSTVGTGSYVLLFCSGAPLQIADGIKPQHAINLAQVMSIVGSGSIAGTCGNFKSLNLSTTGDNAYISVRADELLVEDSTNLYKTLRNVDLAISLSSSGINGLDSGSVAASQWYSAWTIYNPTTMTIAGLAALCPILAGNATQSSAIVTGLSSTSSMTVGMPVSNTLFPAGTKIKSIDSLSQITLTNVASATASASLFTFVYNPVMPNGYTFKARVGMVITDATANKYPLSIFQSGRFVTYKIGVGNTVTLPQMAAGSQGSPSVPTWVPVNTAQFVPPTATKISVNARMTTSTKGLLVAPNNNYGSYSSLTAPPPICMSVTSTGASNGRSATLMLETPNIFYACDDASSGSVCCYGWEDNI